MPVLDRHQHIISSHLSNPTRQLFENVRIQVPNIDAGQIFEVPPDSILGEAKAKMESVDISNLGQVGNLTLQHNLTISNAGLITSPSFRTQMDRLTGTSRAQLQISHRTLLMASIASWQQSDSVIIADELDLNNKTITIQRSSVSHLWIIARRIKARNGAVITYASLVQERSGPIPFG